MRQFLIGLGLLGFLLLPSRTLAAGSVSSLDANIKLDSDGYASINQSIEYNYPSTLRWQMLSGYRELKVMAGQENVTNTIKRVKAGDRLSIVSSTSSTSWTISYRSYANITRHNDVDRYFLKLFEEPGVSVGIARATLQLPDQSVNTDLQGNLYAIGGVNNATTTKSGVNQLTFQSESNASTSLFTISANWPKNAIKYNNVEEIRLSLGNMDVWFWLLAGIILPLIAVIFLARTMIKIKVDEKSVANMVSAPPSKLSPLLTGVIVNKKIYPKEIVALIIDLCQRGYLSIIRKNTEYKLSLRRDLDGGVEQWEQQLIEQIFPFEQRSISITQASENRRKIFYSPKVHGAYGRIYQIITDMNIFTENPHFTRVKYKLAAIFIYFLSLVCVIWVVVSETNPLILLPLLGTMHISNILINLAPKLIYYTPDGIAKRYQWLSFANYLKQTEPLPYTASQSMLFEKYFAYATSFGIQDKWAKRFRHATIVKPEWFFSYNDMTNDQFSHEITKFAIALSRYLANLKGPQVR